MRVKQLLVEKKEALDRLGNSADMDDHEKRDEMLKIIDHFARTYKAQTDGQSRTEISSDELTAGVRIDFSFGETLKADLESLNPLDNITDMDIIKAIRNHRAIGMRLSQPEVIIVIREVLVVFLDDTVLPVNYDDGSVYTLGYER